VEQKERACCRDSCREQKGLAPEQPVISSEAEVSADVNHSQGHYCEVKRSTRGPQAHSGAMHANHGDIRQRRCMSPRNMNAAAASLASSEWRLHDYTALISFSFFCGRLSRANGGSDSVSTPL